MIAFASTINVIKEVKVDLIKIIEADSIATSVAFAIDIGKSDV